MPLFRRRSVPAELREAFGPRERLLASAASADGGHVAATDRALYLPGTEGPRRIGWERVDQATWDKADDVLVVTEDVPRARPRRHTVPLDDATDLVYVVHERVNATVVLSRRIDVHVGAGGDRGATVVARRPPGSDRLVWTVRLDRGVDMADPVTRTEVEAAVAAVRAEVEV